MSFRYYTWNTLAWVYHLRYLELNMLHIFLSTLLPNLFSLLFSQGIVTRKKNPLKAEASPHPASFLPLPLSNMNLLSSENLSSQNRHLLGTVTTLSLDPHFSLLPQELPMLSLCSLAWILLPEFYKHTHTQKCVWWEPYIPFQKLLNLPLTPGSSNSRYSPRSHLSLSPQPVHSALPSPARMNQALCTWTYTLFTLVGIFFSPQSPLFSLNWICCPTLHPHIQPVTPHPLPPPRWTSTTIRLKRIRPRGNSKYYCVKELSMTAQAHSFIPLRKYFWKWFKCGQLSAHQRGRSCNVSSLKLIIGNPFK